MEIDINRVSAFLAGNFPPYYEQYSKMKFMRILLQEASSVFPQKEEFDFIDKHSSSLQVFFKESLSLVEDKKVLENIIVKLKVPFDAQSKYEEKVDVEVKQEKVKTIGFITPFDGEKDDTQEFIQSILDKDYKGWSIKTASLKDDGNGGYLWDTIKDFMEKYDFYIIDFRNGNLNVAIELGYVLNSGKPYTIIIKDKMPSDITGFIYTRKPDLNITGGGKPEEASKKQEELNNKLTKDLKEQLDKYISKT